MIKAAKNPLASIIVRTKDRPKLLKNALRSIAAQNYRPIEVVLVNDGGCELDVEEASGILGDVALNYFRLEMNMGRARAGNVGIENAKGEYIGFLDDDDEFYPNHVVTLVSFLEQSDYKIAYTDALMVYKEYDPLTHDLGKEGRKEVAFSYDFNFDRLVFENYIPFMCLLFGRQPLVASGGFESSLELYEDWDLLVRIGKKYPFYHIKEVTADYNQWSADFQISQANRDRHFLMQTYLKVLSRHIKEITPKRIHVIISEYAHFRQLLKDVQNRFRSQESLLVDRDVRINELINEMGERQNRVNGLNSMLTERDSRINGLANELNETNYRLNGLSDELREKDERIRDLDNKLGGKDVQINSLNSELRERDGRINSLNNELAAKDSRINELDSEVRERNVQINDLNNKLLERESGIGKLSNELNGQVSRIESLAEGLKEKELQISVLSNELKGQDFQIKDLNSKLVQRDAELSALNSAINAKEAEIGALKNTVRERDGLITAMRNTRGWRILEKYRKIRDGVISPLSGGRRGDGGSEE